MKSKFKILEGSSSFVEEKLQELSLDYYIKVLDTHYNGSICLILLLKPLNKENKSIAEKLEN